MHAAWPSPVVDACDTRSRALAVANSSRSVCVLPLDSANDDVHVQSTPHATLTWRMAFLRSSVLEPDTLTLALVWSRSARPSRAALRTWRCALPDRVRAGTQLGAPAIDSRNGPLRTGVLRWTAGQVSSVWSSPSTSLVDVGAGTPAFSAASPPPLCALNSWLHLRSRSAHARPRPGAHAHTHTHSGVTCCTLPQMPASSWTWWRCRTCPWRPCSCSRAVCWCWWNGATPAPARSSRHGRRPVYRCQPPMVQHWGAWCAPPERRSSISCCRGGGGGRRRAARGLPSAAVWEPWPVNGDVGAVRLPHLWLATDSGTLFELDVFPTPAIEAVALGSCPPAAALAVLDTDVLALLGQHADGAVLVVRRRAQPWCKFRADARRKHPLPAPVDRALCLSPNISQIDRSGAGPATVMALTPIPNQAPVVDACLVPAINVGEEASLVLACGQREGGKLCLATACIRGTVVTETDPDYGQ